MILINHQSESFFAHSCCEMKPSDVVLLLSGGELVFFVLVLLILNHYLAFSYFATTWHPFSEVCLTNYSYILLNTLTAVALAI